MARTKITVSGNDVTVERDCPLTGERSRITYFVDRAGGYVRILDSAHHYPQVCERLYSAGVTLMATPETLPAVIRRELRKRQRQEKREMRGF